MINIRAMRRRRAFVSAAFLLVVATPACAQAWQEPSYNPPVGSRWIIHSTTHTVELRGAAGNRESNMDLRSELSIDGKTAEGFRVTLVIRDVSITGDPRKVAVELPMVNVLKGVVMHGRIDGKGSPVSIDNLEEVRGRIQSGIDGVIDKFSTAPAVGAIIKQLLTPMLKLQGKEAAGAYLDRLPQLALYQGTGLRPGDIRSSSETVASPLGNMPIKSTATLRIDGFDAASGKVHFVRERSIDPESLKSFTANLLQQLGSAGGKPLPPEAAKIIQSVKLSLTERAEVEVEGGMTRVIHEQSTMVANALGHTMSKNEIMTLTVTPAP